MSLLPSMANLPTELITSILRASPLHSSTRLTCRLFNAITAPCAFPSLVSFTSRQDADHLLDHAAHEARCRGVTSLWSPRCSPPRNLPIPQSFLLALFIAITGQQWSPRPCGEWESDSAISGVSGDDDREELTVENFARVTGRKDLDEAALRATLFRYALFLSYLHRGDEEAPSLWVFDVTTWSGRT